MRVCIFYLYFQLKSMQDDNGIKKPLIPQNQDSTSPSPDLLRNQQPQQSIHKKSQHIYIGNNSLNYKRDPNIEGECILKSITPIRKNLFRYILFILLCILLAATPLLLIFWYPKLKKKIYYRECSLAQATHFCVINHDDEFTYPTKQQQHHYFNKTQSEDLYYFINRYLKYIIVNNEVIPNSYNFFSEYTSMKKKAISQMTKQKAKLIRKSYGIGAMVIQSKSIPMLFITEIMRPLYLFIVISCLLWLYEEYYYYTIMIFVSAIGGVVTSLIQTYQLNKKIHKMAFYQVKVNILRDNKILQTTSKSVVPGDIVFLKQSMKMPFDGVLLQGSALCNQCSITGQSVPVIKKCENVEQVQKLKNSLIFQGSLLIQVNYKLRFGKAYQEFQQYREQYGLPVMVIRTNFTTLKGQLIRIISFPTIKQNIFERESVKFLLFLFGLSLISYTILTIRLWEYADKLDLFVKLGDLITVTVPPGLPISMTFGIVFALEKMKKKKIYCTSPNKIITGGMTDMICFDKTGTLTEDFMDFYCLVPVDPQQVTFTMPIISGDQKTDMKQLFEKPQNQVALTNMAVNHNIIKLEQTGQYVGDPMQIKMLHFGGFSLQIAHQDNNDQEHLQEISVKQKFISNRGHNGGIIKNFEFSSELFRMSTIAQCNFTKNQFYIYSKGSPQHMYDIMNMKTVPKNYHQMLKQYTARGYRVLAIGSRKIQQKEVTADRLQLETNLNFDGFEVFENKLKPQTQKALQELNNAEIPCVMITGDNALTACSIAYKCEISNEQKITYICTYDNEKYRYKLEKFRDDFHVNNKESEIFQFKQTAEILKKAQDDNAQICMTGHAFNRMFSDTFEELTQQDKLLFWKVTVFARAKPNDKTKIVTIYQHFGKTVAMCGDGANDCGALKQACIGLSLSEAEASISAPFTSKITNISSMVQLIKQCQAGLATNFSIFNIMALYSLIQYNTVLICQYYFGFPSDFSYLYWDLADNFLFFLTFGYTGTAAVLSKFRPSKSLFSISNITSVMIIFFIQLIGQFLMIIGLAYIYPEQIGYYSDITFDQFIQNDNQFVLDSFQGNILFLFSNFIYISTVLAFSISKPWRQQFYKNVLLMVVLVVVVIYSSMIVVWPDSRLDIFQIAHMNYQPLNYFVFYCAIGFAVIIYIVQKYVLEPYFFRLKTKYPNKNYI